MNARDLPPERPAASLPASGRTTTGWLLGALRPHRTGLALVLVLSLAGTGLGLAQPYLTRFLIDDGLLASDMGVVTRLCAAMVAIAVAAAGLGALNRWYHTDISARMLNRLREDLYGRLQRQSPDFHARARAGDLLARLDGDLAELQRFSVDGVLGAVNGTIALAGSLALMLSLSGSLTALALVVLPANAMLLRWLRPHLEQRNRALRERTSDVTSFVVERIASIKLIQSAAAEQRETDRLAGLGDAFRRDLLRQQMVGHAAGAAPALLMSVSTAVVFVAGGHQVVGGSLSLGALVAFSAYLARAGGPLRSLLGLYVAVQRARVSLERVAAIAEAPPAVTDPASPCALPGDAAGRLHLERVAFRYPGEDAHVLRGVDLIAEAGEKIGLIGLSGAGKSTLIDLLHRHYDPDQGRITLDGVDLRHLRLADLRRRIAVVTQDADLLSGSVLDNIRYAAPEAGDQAILDVAARARVDSFARSLPRGLDTEVGARGGRLSGGERQRIAIARALLLDPLLLILDEATSSVDEPTEARIAEAIDELFVNRTRIVISHRASALRGADRVYELTGGRLVERAGTS